MVVKKSIDFLEDKKFSERLIGIDLFRIASVLIVFFFHAQLHIKCSYLILNSFISMGAMFMTAFLCCLGMHCFIQIEKKI